ncbi:MAG TPA: Ig-like domain-containing protein [Nannocystaceae bacterium]|nr:Ig-like domain-containing protein [Nannocystaceae bacterium]
MRMPVAPRVRSGVLGLVVLGCAAVSTPAFAEPPEGEFYRATPIPVPAEYLTPDALADQPQRPQGAAAGTLFINFDGAQLKAGNDNAATNTTQMPSQYVQFAYPAYGDGNQRAATLQAVKKDWAPFNVVVTDVRPAGGAYHMCMTGPGKGGGLPNGVLGIAPLDCDDFQSANIVYAFHSPNDGFPASTQATTISQELAHAFGLEHVKQPSDIMNPYNAGGDPTFMDTCIAIDDGGQGIVCGSQHQQYCGTQTQQNSYKELMGFFGPSTPDTEPPSVSITYPMDGAMFDEGSTFNLTIDASDDQGVDHIDVYYNGGKIKTLAASPYQIELTNVMAGSYAFYATAFDGASNQTMSNTVNFTVVPKGGGTSATGGGTTTTTSGGGTTGGGTSGTGGQDTTGDTSGTSGDASDSATGGGSSGSALPPGYGQSDDDLQGCSCRSDAASMSAAPLVVVLAFARRRRRR